MRLGDLIRFLVLIVYEMFGEYNRLYNRVIYTEVGKTGNLTYEDEQKARELKLKHLSRFEQWLMLPVIMQERMSRLNGKEQELAPVYELDRYRGRYGK